MEVSQASPPQKTNFYEEQLKKRKSILAVSIIIYIILVAIFGLYTYTSFLPRMPIFNKIIGIAVGFLAIWIPIYGFLYLILSVKIKSFGTSFILLILFWIAIFAITIQVIYQRLII